MVLGADNAKAKIDNMVVQRLAPVITFTETVDFDDGSTGTLLGPPATGIWDVANGRYDGTADASGSAISLASLAVSPASLIQLSSTLNTSGEGGFVFDYYDAENFKFVTISAGTIIRSDTAPTMAGSWMRPRRRTLRRESTTALGLTLQGTTVSVTLDDQPVLDHVFNALVTDGGFGLLSRVGTSSFDVFTVGTDDVDL